MRLCAMPRHKRARGVPMTERTPLPPRRPSETRKLNWAGKTVFVTIGYDDYLRAPPVRAPNAPPERLPEDRLSPREIFYDGGYRSGSDMEALVSDLCIALSVMLQHEGVSAASLARSMSTAFELRTGKEKPASILGLLLHEIERPPAWSADLANRLRETSGSKDRREGRP